MPTKNIFIFYCLLCVLIGFNSCKKFLETKSNQSVTTPSTLDDLQMLLDNYILQIGLNSTNTSSDEYYVLYPNWLNLNDVNKKGYVWDPQLNNRNDWSIAYKAVFYANTVLFNLDRIKGDDITKNGIRGAALFIRAHFFYFIAQEFSPQFDPATASTDLGIVLRLNADFNEISQRSTVQQTYQQIIKDLETALELLPETTLFKTRPGKSACLALLARTHLQIGNYEKAKQYADACLKIMPGLIDYNDLPLSPIYPLGDFNKNKEVIYYFVASSATPLNGDETRARIDSNLYASFDANDLRKKVFFKRNADGTYTFRGNYSGIRALFNGLAVDEVYLIRAECNARMNNANDALKDLNSLLLKRWIAGTYILYDNLSPEQTLLLILKERKKELLYRGIRWSDLKRLNKDSRFAVTPKRELNGQMYQLPPNDLRYSILIPLDIIALTNLPQNPR